MIIHLWENLEHEWSGRDICLRLCMHPSYHNVRRDQTIRFKFLTNYNHYHTLKLYGQEPIKSLYICRRLELVSEQTVYVRDWVYVRGVGGFDRRMPNRRIYCRRWILPLSDKYLIHRLIFRPVALT